MKIEIELNAERTCFTAKIGTSLLRSENRTPEVLKKLWMEILEAEVIDGNNEEMGIFYDEEYSPEWPMSIARGMAIEVMQAKDACEWNADYC